MASTTADPGRLHHEPARAGRRPPGAARAAVVDGLARLTTRGFRIAGRTGGIIGGRTALTLDRDALDRLARDRVVVVLVSGTNGKTTTTAMIARAARSIGPVATNSSGANMPDGLVAALLDDPAAPVAVLEVDEAYLPDVIRRIRPEGVVLLNLSRDQLDRAGEVRAHERALRAALATTVATVVANADDVLVASAALASPRPPVWVATGMSYGEDSTACPRCGDGIRWDGPLWWCAGCGLTRPEPGWRLDGRTLTDPGGAPFDLTVGVPGRMNVANAAMATAAAAALGVPVAAAARAAGSVTEAAGRYRTLRLGGRATRLLLAKNPAGWAALLDVLDDLRRGLVIAVDGRQADGTDLSWLWDVPFEQLRGRRVVASGDRAADLCVRLAYAEVEYERVEDPVTAVGRCPEADVDLVATYSPFVAVSRLARAD